MNVSVESNYKGMNELRLWNESGRCVIFITDKQFDKIYDFLSKE